ncbi:precorrin-6y C5,15-methyltransferase (decarboxylating) subunit CbiE [Candidatus Endowatersipora endosymbiont of Watersipora subatra]|uniref:precorrin-6y C5,15-methyltransferase (decarboxylating) subunit CbiE n=1 Tax=Candidatus Endowatersipora endosymbiont of Watersipora subatra TaxID=3077946 RepID=UPI00312CACCF
MTSPWLNIIGIGEDGLAGLSYEAIRKMKEADIIVGGKRHHFLTKAFVKAQRICWSLPLEAMIREILLHRGKSLVILVTGDPLWYSIGVQIAQAITSEEIRFYPQLSAFQLAACRLGWSLSDCDTLTIHGRSDRQIVPYLAPRARLLILTENGQSPSRICDILTHYGFGGSKITVLAALGGEKEERFEGVAETWNRNVPDLNTMAVECHVSDRSIWYPRIVGLPDDAFVHDGQLTKQLVRTATLTALAPHPNAILWDIGAGCGSVGIEWIRASSNAHVYAIEYKEKRLQMISENCVALGTEKICIVSGKAPSVLTDLPTPDSVFIGGGLTSEGVFEKAWSSLRPGGRLVANTVTLDSEKKLIALYHDFGGELRRINIQKAEPIGSSSSWRSSMPMTQWIVMKSWRKM